VVSFSRSLSVMRMASHRDTPSLLALASINAIRSGDMRTPTIMLCGGIGVTLAATSVVVKTAPKKI